MERRRVIPAIAAGLVCLCVLVAPVSATTLTLDTGKSLELQPGVTDNFTFSATNDSGAISNFLGYAIGFQIVPVGSPTGSLTVGPITVSPVNPLPAPGPTSGTVDFTQPNLATLAGSAEINGSTQFWSIGASANEEIQTVNPLGNYNLGAVAFTLSENAAVGDTWAIHAVQQAGIFIKSYWVDEDFNDFVFGNWPSSPVGNTSVQVGTITAVPEPGSLMLAGSAITAAGWYGWRSRRHRGGVAIHTADGH